MRFHFCGRREMRGDWQRGERGYFHHGRGGRRMFDQGDLRLVILRLLQ